MKDAWQELDYPSPEDTLAWDFMFYQLSFKPSIHSEDFPGILEPMNSITYNFSEYFKLEPDEVEIRESELNQLVHRAFCRLTNVEESIYSLDWQHQCYIFFPHKLVTPQSTRVWEIPVLPNGDYYIFLQKDFEFGTFGHPWEKTICFFGQDLVNLIEQDTPQILGSPIRRNGKNIK